MNATIIRGKQNEMAGRLTQLWGYVTNNRSTMFRGKRREIKGVLQQRYGRFKEQLHHVFS